MACGLLVAGAVDRLDRGVRGVEAVRPLLFFGCRYPRNRTLCHRRDVPSPSMAKTYDAGELHEVARAVMQADRVIKPTKIRWAAVRAILGSEFDELNRNSFLRSVKEAGSTPTDFLRERLVIDGDPAQRYVMTQCPEGRPHVGGFIGYPAQFGEPCPKCEIVRCHDDVWWTFTEVHPERADLIVNDDPGQPLPRPFRLDWRCEGCGCRIGRGYNPWAQIPERGEEGVLNPLPPLCRPCLAERTKDEFGTIAFAEGMAAASPFEKKLADELCKLGLDVQTDRRVVVAPTLYVNPWIKPDLVVLGKRIAIEYDLDSPKYFANHGSPNGAADDYWRDALAADVGWRTLRVREKYQPTLGDWPWKVEATASMSCSVLAGMVIEAIDAKPHGAGCGAGDGEFVRD